MRTPLIHKFLSNNSVIARSKATKQSFSLVILLAFLINTVGSLPNADANEFVLPKPGVMVHTSPEFNPPVLKGIKVHPDNPFKFDFILDPGDSQPGDGVIASEAKQSFLKEESNKLIKYFLASITTPEKDLWVNLSPYEKDRIVPDSFGKTEMGRDVLAQDYLLKQITATLMYPEDEVGKKFWKRIYEESAKRFGTTNVPVNTFNKVWIVPDKAVVYENAKLGTAYVVESHLKVMLESDYLAQSKNDVSLRGTEGDVAIFQKQIIRDIIIPELEKEVNTGKNFAQLRQVYQSLILANWYKKKIKDSILSKAYADRNKIAGVQYKSSVIASAAKQSFSDSDLIYQQYLQAFKKGVYNYIKEEPFDSAQGRQMISRKYFSGGATFLGLGDMAQIVNEHTINGTMRSIIHNATNLNIITSTTFPVTASQAMRNQRKNELLDNAMLTSHFSSPQEILDSKLIREEDPGDGAFNLRIKPEVLRELSQSIIRDLSVRNDGTIILSAQAHLFIPMMVLEHAITTIFQQESWEIPEVKHYNFNPRNKRYFNAVIQSSGQESLAVIEKYLMGQLYREDVRISNPERLEHRNERYIGYPVKTWFNPQPYQVNATELPSRYLNGKDKPDFVYSLHQEDGGTVIRMYYRDQLLPVQVVRSIVDYVRRGREQGHLMYYPLNESDWINIYTQQSKENVIAQRQEYVDQRVNQVFGELLPIFGDKVVEFAELLFAVEPQRFKGVDLREIVLRKFYLESQSESIVGEKAPEQAVLDPKVMLEHLYEYLISQGKNWEEIDAKIRELAINFALDIAQRYWKKRFAQDSILARQELEVAISTAGHNVLIAEVLMRIKERDQEIIAVEKEIAQKGILKGLTVQSGEVIRQGTQLEYYQLDNIVRMRKEKKVILADDPGLGKTLQMLVFALLEGSNEIFIGVGPLLAKESVKRDIKKWINWDIDFIEVTAQTSMAVKKDLLTRKNARRSKTQARIQLWHFGQLPKVADTLVNIQPFDFVGLDEAHWIKNNESGRSQAAQLLKAEHVVLSTATPVDNHLEDVRVLLKIVLNLNGEAAPQELEGFLANDADFLNLFRSDRLDSIALLRALLKRKLIRNRIGDVRGNLKKVNQYVLHLDLKNAFFVIGDQRMDLLTPKERTNQQDPFVKQRELYEKVYQWLQSKMHERYRLTGVNVLRRILADVHGVIAGIDLEKNSELNNFIGQTVQDLDRKYPQPWVGIKERMLEHLASTYKDAKMLVFLGFKGTIEQYVNIMEHDNTGVITGDVGVNTRKVVQNNFATGKLKHIITTYGTGGISIDLTAATMLVFETPPVKGSDRKQGIGRVIRVSDNGDVLKGQLNVFDVIVDPWSESIRSADDHFRLLNHYKGILALMLEDGVISREVVEEFVQIDKIQLKGFYHIRKDRAMSAFADKVMRVGQQLDDVLPHHEDKGGIDLTSDKALSVQNDGNGEINFQLSPEQLQQFQNAPGFVPIIINIQPMTNLEAFLGLF